MRNQYLPLPHMPMKSRPSEAAVESRQVYEVEVIEKTSEPAMTSSQRAAEGDAENWHRQGPPPSMRSPTPRIKLDGSSCDIDENR